MEIILMNDVVGLGDVGDTVKVRPGYARNYLIPRGLAVESGGSSARVMAHRMRQVEAKKKKLKATAELLADRIRNVKLELPIRVGSSGRVFGSLGTKDIAAALLQSGYEIDRRRVILSEPIRKSGTHIVSVKLHPEVQASIKVEVVEVAASKEDEEKATERAREQIETAVAAKDDNEQ